jgi:hypothetical protein
VNWEAIGAIGEIVGAGGVIVSLLYLAVQVQAATRANRRENAHQLNEATRGWWAQLSEDSERASIWQRGLTDYASLTPTEALQFSAMVLHLMTISEELHFARIDKDVPHWVGSPYRIGRREIVSLPGFSAWYAERGHWLSPEFREVVEAEMRDGVDRVASFLSRPEGPHLHR